MQEKPEGPQRQPRGEEPDVRGGAPQTGLHAAGVDFVVGAARRLALTGCGTPAIPGPPTSYVHPTVASKLGRQITQLLPAPCPISRAIRSTAGGRPLGQKGSVLLVVSGAYCSSRVGVKAHGLFQEFSKSRCSAGHPAHCIHYKSP